VVELRRDILWSRENADRSADLLRALTARPENGLDEGIYLQLRTAIRRLESGIDGISEETRDQVAEILWNAALFWRKAISTTRWNGCARRRNG
jgi:hypothetical protein